MSPDSTGTLVSNPDVIQVNPVVFAGTGDPGYYDDGGLASAAKLNQPLGVAVDTEGNVYFVDRDNHCIRKVYKDTAGGDNFKIMTIAGTGVSGYDGDGGLATAAKLNQPYGVAVDNKGNVYFADLYNHRIRKVYKDTAGGDNFKIMTVAGTGVSGYEVDGGLATAAKLNFPSGVAVDNKGNVYFADSYNHRIRKLYKDTAGGDNFKIMTIAGTGDSSYDGDGGLATAAKLNEPVGVAVDNEGNVYIADAGNHRIRKLYKDTAGGDNFKIMTVAGTGVSGYDGDIAYGVAVDSAGNVYFADSNYHRIRKVYKDTADDTNFKIMTIAGTGVSGYDGDGGLATAAKLNEPVGVAVDTEGNVYFADSYNHRIRKLYKDTAGGDNFKIMTVAGTGVRGYEVDGGLATAAKLNGPYGVAVDNEGNVYIADSNNKRIRKVGKDGKISTFAGGGQESTNESLATDYHIDSLYGVAVDNNNNVYFTIDFPGGGLCKVYKLNSEFKIDKIADFALPRGVAVDKDGKNVYVADFFNGTIYKVGPLNAGNLSSSIVASPSPYLPYQVAVDSKGNVYFDESSSESSLIRKVVIGSSVPERVAGTELAATSLLLRDGIGSLATEVKIPDSLPIIAVDNQDNLYISVLHPLTAGQPRSFCLRKVDSKGIVREVLFDAVGQPFTNKPNIQTISGMAFDQDNNLYIADALSHKVFKATAVSITPTAVNSPITIPDNAAYNFGTGEFTIMAVVTPKKIEGSGDSATTVIATGNIISKDASPSAGGWKLEIIADKIIGDKIIGDSNTPPKKSLSFTLLDSKSKELKVTAELKPKFAKNQQFFIKSAEKEVDYPLAVFNQFTHVVTAVRDVQNNLKLYLNGEQVGPSLTTAVDVTNTSPIKVGDLVKTASGSVEQDVIVRKAALWNRALTQEEIINYMNHTKFELQPMALLTTTPPSVFRAGGTPSHSMLAVEYTGTFSFTGVNSPPFLYLVSYNNIVPDRTWFIPPSLDPPKLTEPASKNLVKTLQEGAMQNLLAKASESDGVNYGYEYVYPNFNPYYYVWGSKGCKGYWDFVEDGKDKSSTNNNPQTPIPTIPTIQSDETVLPLYMQEQKQDVWCWAAVGVSIANFYDPLLNKEQCTLAKEVLTKLGKTQDPCHPLTIPAKDTPEYTTFLTTQGVKKPTIPAKDTPEYTTFLAKYFVTKPTIPDKDTPEYAALLTEYGLTAPLGSAPPAQSSEFDKQLVDKIKDAKLQDSIDKEIEREIIGIQGGSYLDSLGDHFSSLHKMTVTEIVNFDEATIKILKTELKNRRPVALEVKWTEANYGPPHLVVLSGITKDEFIVNDSFSGVTKIKQASFPIDYTGIKAANIIEIIYTKP